MSLNYFFNPRAVAIIGASNNRHKLGRQLLDNIIKGGFKGKVYPLNLKEKTIAGLKAYADLADLPRGQAAALLVIIVIPAPFVVAEIKKCAQLGIKNIIIVSAGFKEAGPEGKVREEEIIDLAKIHHLNILGPNCLGLINTWHGLNATFAGADRETGQVAILSQSGAIGSAALDWLKAQDFNLGYFISLGNKAVLDENDIFEYLARDERIELVIAYLEEIKEGEKFMSLVSRLAKHKPVAVLKAGQSTVGGQLALSHTGALAGSAAAVETGVRRAGAIWLTNLEELFNLLSLFRKEAWENKGAEDLYVITNAGGVAVLTADAVSRQGLTLGRSWDLLGDADAARYEMALKKLLPDKKVNNLLVLLTPQTDTEPLKTAQAVSAAAKKYPHKLIMACFLGGNAVQGARDLLEKNHVPVFDFPEEAVETFKKLLSYKKSAKNLRPYRLVAHRPKNKLRSTDYLRSLQLLKQYRIPTVPTAKMSPAKVKSRKEPVVLKIVGPDFLHKTDKSAVVANLTTEKGLRATYRALRQDNQKLLANPKNYIIIQPQINKAQEIILGFKRDVAFGPIMVAGLGGIYTEVFKEVKLETSDLDFNRAIVLIESLVIYPILNGARGHKKYDIKGVARALVNLSRLANEHPEISELDINPLFVTETGVAAGDVRIIL